MIETAIVVVRLLQYFGAAVLFGSSLFFIYALPASGRGSAADLRLATPLLAGAAALLALSSLLAIAAQASLFAGSWDGGLTLEAMGAVAFSMDLGRAAVVRAVVSGAALAFLLVLAPGPTRWLVTAGLGAVAVASLAWMGHGAATGGAWGSAHLTATIIHALTASIWVGALAGLLLVGGALGHGLSGAETLYAALRRFSAIGVAVVILLVLSGLVNSWVLVGPKNVLALADTAYGRLLLVKLAMFAAMLILAALNRNRYTPALAATLAGPYRGRGRHLVQRAVFLELALGLAIFFLVARIGTLAPPAG